MPRKDICVVPMADAQRGAVARNVPVVDAALCAGCRFMPVCEKRGRGTTFLVEGLRSRANPIYCRRIGALMLACEVTPLGDVEPRRAVPTKPRLRLVCDATVFINAERWNWECCNDVLARAGERYELVTTELVMAELVYAYKLPATLSTIATGIPHPRLVELAAANADVVDPEERASAADLSLVQALLEDPTLAGVLSEDGDVRGLHPPSLVRELTGREVVAYSCDEFRRKHAGWFS